MTRTPEVRLDEDGRHVWWCHECTVARTVVVDWDPDDPSTWDYWHETMLPLNDERGWRVESTDPLTIIPSILCGSCGTHGFWRNGGWISV